VYVNIAEACTEVCDVLLGPLRKKKKKEGEPGTQYQVEKKRKRKH